jgi:hypothetical protein
MVAADKNDGTGVAEKTAGDGLNASVCPQAVHGGEAEVAEVLNRRQSGVVAGCRKPREGSTKRGGAEAGARPRRDTSIVWQAEKSPPGVGRRAGAGQERISPGIPRVGWRSLG